MLKPYNPKKVQTRHLNMIKLSQRPSSDLIFQKNFGRFTRNISSRSRLLIGSSQHVEVAKNILIAEGVLMYFSHLSQQPEHSQAISLKLPKSLMQLRCNLFTSHLQILHIKVFLSNHIAQVAIIASFKHHCNQMQALFVFQWLPYIQLFSIQ